MVTLYHVTDVLFVTVDVMSDSSGFICRVECVYEVCPSDMYLQVRQFFLHRYDLEAGCAEIRM